MKQYFLYASLVVLAACSSTEQKTQTPDIPQAPLGKSANSDAFNQSFGKVMGSYYLLKDNFITEQDVQIRQAAQRLMGVVDSLPLTELKADSAIITTARTYTEGISAELKGLLGEKNIEAQRKSFQMVSDQLYDLIRTVQYDRAVVYHDFCPMAFNEQGANWLSYSSEIQNPYLPKKMLTCGEVKDSIDFRPKQ